MRNMKGQKFSHNQILQILWVVWIGTIAKLIVVRIKTVQIPTSCLRSYPINTIGRYLVHCAEMWKQNAVTNDSSFFVQDRYR